MTEKNPHSEARKRLTKAATEKKRAARMQKMFAHKSFAESFQFSNVLFMGLGFLAQLASLITAVTMIYFLFSNSPTWLRILLAGIIVILIEAAKRESLENVMKGFFQYGEVERIPAAFAALVIAASVFVSVEGSKLVPNLFVADAEATAPTLQAASSIHQVFDERIQQLKTDRDDYVKSRTYRGRIRKSDADEVQKFNAQIAAANAQRDEELSRLAKENEASTAAASTAFAAAQEQVVLERATMASQLVKAAIIFEFLFVVSMAFQWWYFSECRKEQSGKQQGSQQGGNKQKQKQKQGNQQQQQKTKNDAPPSGDRQQDQQVRAALETDLEPMVQLVQQNPIGFVQGHMLKGREETAVSVTSEVTPELVKSEKQTSLVTSEVTEYIKNTSQVIPPDNQSDNTELVKYTRKCKHCGTPYVHKNTKHMYCTRTCYLAARKLEQKSLVDAKSA